MERGDIDPAHPFPPAPPLLYRSPIPSCIQDQGTRCPKEAEMAQPSPASQGAVEGRVGGAGLIPEGPIPNPG